MQKGVNLEYQNRVNETWGRGVVKTAF